MEVMPKATVSIFAIGCSGVGGSGLGSSLSSLQAEDKDAMAIAVIGIISFTAFIQVT